MFRQNFLSVSKAGECTGYHHQRIARQGYSVWQVPFIFWNRDISSNKCPSQISAPPPHLLPRFPNNRDTRKSCFYSHFICNFLSFIFSKISTEELKAQVRIFKISAEWKGACWKEGTSSRGRGGRPCYSPVLILLFQGIQ